MRNAIAVDVGGTTIKAGVVSGAGELALERTAPTTASPVRLAQQLGRIVGELRGDAKRQGIDVVRTIGVGVPGIVNEDQGLGVYSANLGWSNVPLRAMFETEFGAPVAFGHDVRSGALAEMIWGVGSSTMIYLAIGTGIGAGVILDGKAWVNNGYAGELGQALVNLDGRDVVLEEYASATGIQRRYEERSGVQISGAKDVFAAARGGDEAAEGVIEDAVTLIARVTGSTLALLGSMDVVLGGGLARAGEELTEPLSVALSRRLRVSPLPAVVGAELGAWSQCLGAGYRALAAEDVPILHCSTTPRDVVGACRDTSDRRAPNKGAKA